MKIINILLILCMSLISAGAENVSTSTGGPAIEIAAAVPPDIAFTIIVRDNSILLENLIENGVITREDLSGAFEDISGVEDPDGGSVFDIFSGETAIAVYDRRDFGSKDKSFDPGLLIVAEMPADKSDYRGFEDDLINYIKSQEEETETETWYSKTEIRIKDKKYRDTKYRQVKKKKKTESRYTDTDGVLRGYEDESETEFYFGYDDNRLIVSTQEKMFKKAVDTALSGDGLSGSIGYLSCLNRINPDSDLITYTPFGSFDILADALEQEYRGEGLFPFGDLLGDIEGMMTAASLGETGPTDEAVILLPDSGDNPFIRALGKCKELHAPGNVPSGYTAYFFYACESVNHTIVEVVPSLASSLEDSDASKREIREIIGTIAYFQELSPGLLSSAGDEIALVYRQLDKNGNGAEGTSIDRELPDRLRPENDEFVLAFNIADVEGFKRGVGYLDENTPENEITAREESGTTYYQFISDDVTEAVFAIRGSWGYGALRQDTLDYFIERLESESLGDDNRFRDGMDHLQTEHNALVYLDYTAAFEANMDNDRLSALIRPTMISIAYDGEAVEIEGYPYNFWTYLFSTSYALGSMDTLSAGDIDDYPDTMGGIETPNGDNPESK